MTAPTVELADAVVSRDRVALARAITLVESTREDHRRSATDLIERLLPSTGDAVRVGISGPPGVGKSSLIEALGLEIVQGGHRVAVLAVDPTSPKSGGSILGDKTRMEALSRSEHAFIRPSPSGATVGGVARRTRECMLVCEAAGFDVVVVETVGTGQSDIAVADLVDVFVVLVQPSAGDELQGIKRGVMELADVLVVTKADGDLADAARRSVADHRAALALLRPGDTPAVLASSTVDDPGVGGVWEAIATVHERRAAEDGLGERRGRQARRLLWSELREALLDRFLDDTTVGHLLPEVEAAVTAGAITPSTGAQRLIDASAP